MTRLHQMPSFFQENAFWGGRIKGQHNRVVGDSHVISLGIHREISEIFQFLAAKLTEI